MAARISSIPPSVWTRFTQLALKHNAVNLGQGVVEFPVDPFVKRSLVEATKRGVLQYTRSAGHPRLVKALADTYSPLLQPLDPLTNITVTVGATGAIYAACQAFLDPNDEAIVLDPAYDSYAPSVALAGAIPVHVPYSSNWKFDPKLIENAITPSTKMILFTNPHNPLGQCASREELESIASIAKRHNLLVLSDEVYERLTFGVEHIRMASLPGMFERTLTLGSAGKTFSVTGFKVGWVIAPERLISPLASLMTISSFCVSSVLQEALADCFEQEPHQGFFAKQCDDYTRKRDCLVTGLVDAGFDVTVPDGAYFVLANVDHLDIANPRNEPKDFAVAEWLTTEAGVAAIPFSAFYPSENVHLAGNHVRFAFCKSDEQLSEAGRRLGRLK